MFEIEVHLHPSKSARRQTTGASGPGLPWLICVPYSLDGALISQATIRRAPFLRSPMLSSDANHALNLVVAESPRFVVIDQDFVPMNTLPRFIRAVASRGSKVILCVRRDAGNVEEMGVLAGASAFYTRGSGVSELLDSIRRALDGRPAEVSEPGLMWAAPRRAEGVSLTPAEQRVVDALFTPGASTVSAAAALGISVNTVRNHVSNIRGKIGATPARNLDSLRFALMQLGILEPYPKVTSDDGVDAGLV